MGFTRINRNELETLTISGLIGLPLKQRKIEARKSSSSLQDTSMPKEMGKKKIIGFEGKKAKIVIKEYENVSFSHYGDILEYKTGGDLVVENPSLRDVLWALDFLIDDPKNVLETNSFQIESLKIKDVWGLNYKEEKQKKPNITISESVSARTIEGANHTVILGEKNDIYFTLKVKNSSENHVSDLEVNKIIPAYFSDFEVLKKPSNVKVFYEDQVFSFYIDRLRKGEEVVLQAKADVTPKDSDFLKTGLIEARYLIETESTNLDVLSFNGRSRTIIYIEIDEVEEEPGHLINRMIFRNASDFNIKVKNIRITSFPSSETSEVYLETDTGFMIHSGHTWISDEWFLKSEERPKYHSEIDFSVDYEVEKTGSGFIRVGETFLYITDFKANKTYSETVFRSFESQNFSCEIKIENTGSALINEIEIIDTIPKGFKPPSLKDIEIKAGKKEIKNNKVNLEIKPDSLDSSEPHTLIIKVKGLKKLVGGLKTGEELTVLYPLIVEKPNPKDSYYAPLEISINTFPIGLPLSSKLSQEELPSFTVIHERERVSVGKMVDLGREEEEFEIAITVKNRSDKPIETLKIQDFIPSNFKVVKAEQEYTVKEEEDSKENEGNGWTVVEQIIGILDIDEEVEIKYIVNGKGKMSKLQERMALAVL